MPVEVVSLSFFTFIFVKYSGTTKKGGMLVRNMLVSMTLQLPKGEECW